MGIIERCVGLRVEKSVSNNKNQQKLEKMWKFGFNDFNNLSELRRLGSPG
jgi:hypothetical protein